MLFAIVSFALTQDAAGRALDAAVAAYADVRTARATFEQTVTNPLTGTTLRSRGEFEQQRPNRFAFRFTDPAGDVIISDGTQVWLYLPSSTPGQVIRSPLSRDPAHSLDLIGEFFNNPRARYAVADGGAATVDGRSTRIVVLAPRGAGASFARARVWIDDLDGRLRQFEAEEPSGVTRVVHITTFSPNAAVPRSAFTFTPPRGVRVVEQP